MNTVAHPLSDGSQPGSVRTSSPEPVQAAPFPHPLGMSEAVSSALTRGDDNAKSASVPEYDSDLNRRRRPGECGAEHQPFHDSATHNALAESAADEISAPFPNPHVSTSHSCGNSAMSAVTRVPPLSLHEDPCLSAQLAMGIS